MSSYLIVGAGQQGIALGYFLGKFSGTEDTEIGFIDKDGSKTANAIFKLNDLLSDKENVGLLALSENLLKNSTELKKFNVLISALPSRFNLAMTKIAMEANINYCDYGFHEDIVRQQKSEFDSRAKAWGLSAILNCGIEPGLAYNIALGVARELKPDTVRVYVGGNPINPQVNTLQYQKAFDGVAYEYSSKVTVLEKGQLIKKEVPSELEEFLLLTENGPGKLTAFFAQTSFGLVAESLRKIGVVNASAKTIRWPNHYTIIRAISELGLFNEEPIEIDNTSVSPLKLMNHLLNNNLQWVEEDFLIMKIKFEKNGKLLKEVSMKILHNKETGLTAMQQATSAPVAVVAKLLAEKKLASGVYVQEEVLDYKYVMQELKKMGLRIGVTDF
ncbi:MAG: saccharopine dehydrogenase C-terminal domain-containing protein [bacterium]|nr:saccharopine dehydrogenase C-terminal domain-containing protein [bacterium]